MLLVSHLKFQLLTTQILPVPVPCSIIFFLRAHHYFTYHTFYFSFMLFICYCIIYYLTSQLEYACPEGSLFKTFVPNV